VEGSTLREEDDDGVTLEQCGLGWRVRTATRRRPLSHISVQRPSLIVEVLPSSSSGAVSGTGGSTSQIGTIERIHTPLCARQSQPLHMAD
jgi:hypothetical protein